MSYLIPQADLTRQNGVLGLVKHQKARIYYSESEFLKHQAARVKRELKASGVSRWGLMYGESRYIHKLLHPEEQIEASVYGRNRSGRVMLVATDKRILFVDKKPFFVKTDELTYEVVSGIVNTQSGLYATVVLHTRIGDYGMRTMNIKCAHKFRDFIEARCLEHPYSPHQRVNY